MIERVEIRNWQALRNIDLDLGRFTVIVGPSSSGKSALMRAMRAIASNVRGTGSITRGQKTCAITVRTGDATITLERGEGSGVYKMLDPTGQITQFTKLAGGVPSQITDALRIAPIVTGAASLNFAGQFDKPYLLDESGATVARELGELTKVNILFEAVRAANKRRSAQASALKTRQADLAALQARVTEFVDLPAKLAAIAAAEQTAHQLAQVTDRVTRLRNLVDRLSTADIVRRQAQVPEIPDITPLLAILDRRDLLTKLTRDWQTQTTYARGLEHEISEAATRQTHLDGMLAEVLRSAGTCPLCGQTIH